jgi:hypothetical protein
MEEGDENALMKQIKDRQVHRQRASIYQDRL